MILQSKGECITVDVPSVSFGIYELAIDPSDYEEEKWIANKPRLDWMYPEIAIAGEQLRIIGRCLADVSRYVQKNPAMPVSYGGLRKGQTVLVGRRGGDDKFFKIPVEKSSAYEIYAKLPLNLQAGEYEIFAHNGKGGVSGWSEPFKITVEKKQPWPAKVFEVDKYIIKTEGNIDEAISRALKDLKNNGGGILAFGNGTYSITRTIELPERCVVRGEGADRTCIVCPTQGGPLPPWVIITGNGNFVIEDIRLFSVYSVIAIAVPVFRPRDFEEAMKVPFSWSEVRAKNVVVRRCRIEQAPSYMLLRRQDADPEWRKWLLEWIATSDGQSHNGFVAIRIRGDGGTIEDNEIWGGGSGIILTGCSYIRVARNNIKIGCSGHGIYVMGHVSWPEDWNTNPDAKPHPVIGNYSHRVGKTPNMVSRW